MNEQRPRHSHFAIQQKMPKERPLRTRPTSQPPNPLHWAHIQAEEKPPAYLTSPTPPMEETAKRRRPGRRTESPLHAAAAVAKTTTRGNSRRSVTAAESHDEKEHGSGRPKRRTRRRRSHTSAATGHTHPHPIYTRNAQIRGSPTLPPPERTEKGEGTHGGAGEPGERRRFLPYRLSGL